MYIAALHRARPVRATPSPGWGGGGGAPSCDTGGGGTQAGGRAGPAPVVPHPCAPRDSVRRVVAGPHSSWGRAIVSATGPPDNGERKAFGGPPRQRGGPACKQRAQWPWRAPGRRCAPPGDGGQTVQPRGHGAVQQTDHLQALCGLLRRKRLQNPAEGAEVDLQQLVDGQHRQVLFGGGGQQCHGPTKGGCQGFDLI